MKGLAPLWARFKQRPDWFKAVAAVVVASAAVFAGVGAANALAPKVEEPTPSAERSSAAAGSFGADEAAGAEIAEDAEVAENPGAAQAADSGADAERPDPRVVADTALAALDAASFAEGVVLFDSVTGISRTLEPDEAPAVFQALEAYAAAGYDVGFVVYDLATQRGVSYNADQGFFSASTVKAPFAAYVVQSEVDGGGASLDDEMFEDLVMEGTGVMAFDDTSVYALRDVLSNAIVHSDNTGYALLRERFDDGGFEAWCASAGVDAGAWEGEWYPHYSALDLAKLWINVGFYLAEGQGLSSWYADLLSQTDSSFLRAALGDRGAVLSKPGFEIDSYWGDIGALNDAGVILSDGGVYVAAIMSDADYDSDYLTEDGYLIADLASALGGVHDDLLSPDVREEGEGA